MGRTTRTLITGGSDMGKSFYAMQKAEKRANAGIAQIVYSSTIDDKWPGCELYRELPPFIERVNQLKVYSDKRGGILLPANLWIDEGDEVFSISQKENNWLIKKGRHYFPEISVLTQRPKMVNPTARGQCNELIAFALKSEDAAELGRDFVADLSELPNLRVGEYLHVHIVDRARVVDKVDGFAAE